MIDFGTTLLEMELPRTSYWPQSSNSIVHFQPRSHTPKMSPSPPGSPSSVESSGIRRYRRTTACTTCRDRRVKCSRDRPSCTQCKKGGRLCKYLNSEIPEFEFIEVNLSRSPARKSPSPVMSNPISERKSGIKLKTSSRSVVKQSQIISSRFPPKILANDIDTPFHQPIKNLAITLGALGEDFISYFRTKVPAREVCDHFLNNFIGLQSAVPICNIDTLIDEYTSFWANLSPETSLETTLLILAVLYCGAANSTINISQATTLHDLYEQLLDIVNLPTYHCTHRGSSAIQLLQAYLLVNTFQASTSSSQFRYGFLLHAIRLAQSLQLHFDKPYQSNGFQAEVEKRIWWHLLFLDLQSTITTGAPLLITRNGYENDVSLPMVLNPASSQDSASPMMIAFYGQCQWARCMRDWIMKMPTQGDAVRLVESIENLLNLLPGVKAENLGPRAYLKLLIDNVYCLLGLNFCQAKQLQDIGWRNDIVRAASSFLQNYLFLSDTTSITPLKCILSGLIQPHHAVFILLMHLSLCTSLDSNAQSLKILVDKVFDAEISSPRLGVSRAASRSPEFTHSSPTSRILRKSYGYCRQEILILLYRKVQAKLGRNTPKFTVMSRPTSPNIGVLPQLKGLVSRDAKSNIVSSENSASGHSGTKWMELAMEMNTEDCMMDRELDDVLRGGRDVWNKWERLIGAVSKC
ncbi:putative c6 transcription factor protein [Botrytis fragariae]|uniref:Putative c6 transcription factor protein n=1 Tax=Botrytis fragariae TaxID=1964551 RepID=A0A8H6EEB1_9HELO|nr:putative c6 transcription factor protein [Botrytis fragariae]KAF5868755.1 putative c6 transcription factor protein [Botrytis fragariae]